MYHESILDKLFDEDNDDIIELKAEGGKIFKFEQIAVVQYDGEMYAIMRPMELKEDQVVIFKLDMEDETGMDMIFDEELIKKILEVYHEDVFAEDDE